MTTPLPDEDGVRDNCIDVAVSCRGIGVLVVDDVDDDDNDDVDDANADAAIKLSHPNIMVSLKSTARLHYSRSRANNHAQCGGAQAAPAAPGDVNRTETPGRMSRRHLNGTLTGGVCVWMWMVCRTW